MEIPDYSSITEVLKMRRLLAGVVFLSVSSIAMAQSPTKISVEGAWKVAEVATTGTNASTYSNPQPGLYLFTKTHYSTVAVTSPNVRKGNPPLADPSKATDAEKSARYDEWEPFVANSGTYEIKGTTLILHAVVAKNAGFMMSAAPTITIIGFKLEGNTLTLTQKTQPGPLGLDIRIKLVRVE